MKGQTQASQVHMCRFSTLKRHICTWEACVCPFISLGASNRQKNLSTRGGSEAGQRMNSLGGTYTLTMSPGYHFMMRQP